MRQMAGTEKLMSKQVQRSVRKAKEDSEGRKEYSLKVDKEERCRIDLLSHLEEILTKQDYKKLMEDIYRVEVSHLWDDRWRINFWKKQEVHQISISHSIKASFFVVYDPDFGVISMNPDPKVLILTNFIGKKGNIFK